MRAIDSEGIQRRETNRTHAPCFQRTHEWRPLNIRASPAGDEASTKARIGFVGRMESEEHSVDGRSEAPAPQIEGIEDSAAKERGGAERPFRIPYVQGH